MAGTTEVAAIDLGESFGTLRRRWWLVVLATIAGSALGAALLLRADAVWESETTVEVGTLLGKPLEDSATLVRFVESEAFRAGLSPRLGDAIRALGVPAETPGAPPLIKIRVRAHDPSEARRLATEAAAALEQRYSQASDAALRELDDYHQSLQRTAKQLEGSIAQLEAGLARLDPAARDSALTLLALQTQIDARRADYLRFVRELKDSAVQQALNTRPTKRIGDVAVTESPTWPEPLAFMVIGAMLGLLAGAAAALAAPGPRRAR